MSNIDNRNQVVLGIDFTRNYTSIAIFSMEESSEIEYVTYNNRPIPAGISINRESGEVLVAKKAQEQEGDLYFNSVYNFIDSNKEYDIAGHKWNKEDLLSAALEEIKEYILNKYNNTRIIKTVISINKRNTDKYKEYFKKAGEIANLNIIDLLKRPVSIIKNHYRELEEGKYLLVDVSQNDLSIYSMVLDKGILSIQCEDHYMEQFYDMDSHLTSFIIKQLNENIDFDIKMENLTEEEQNTISKNVSEIKEAFLKRPSAEINIKNIQNVIGFKKAMMIEEYYKVLNKVYQEIEKLTNQFLLNNSLDIGEFDYMFLTGCGVKAPRFIDEFRDKFDIDVLQYMSICEWQGALGNIKAFMEPIGLVLDTDIKIILADDSQISIVNKNQNLEDIDEIYYFGLTEDQPYAQLVLLVKDLAHLIKAPVYGFIDETVALEMYINEDQNLTISFGSTKQPVTTHEQYVIESVPVAYRINSGETYEI